MKSNKKKKLNNSGFSLVELLIALAVSAVVITIIGAFVTQGTSFYTEQGNSVNLQNELQELSNVVTEAVQEATHLDIRNIGDGSKTIEVYTGEYEDAIKGFDLKDKKAARFILLEGKDLYLFDEPRVPEDTRDKEGHRYSKYVSGFKVSINKNSIKDGQIVQPIMLDISIEVSNRISTKNDPVRSETKTITLRNIIDRIYIDGTEYKKADIGTNLVLPSELSE